MTQLPCSSPVSGRPRSGHLIRVILSILLVTGVLSCSARQDMTVSLDGSGTANLEIEIHPVLQSYLQDLSGGFGSNRGGPDGTFAVFDIDEIERTFATRPEIELRAVETPDPARLRLTLAFPDLNEVLRAAPGVDGIITIVRRGENTEMRVRLGPAEVRRLLALSPLSGTIMEEVLLPPEQYPMSAAEYREYIAWALEEYEEPAVIGRIIDRAAILVRVSVQGELLSQTGGRRDGNTAVFEIPVTELLTLRQTREYSLQYR